MSEQKQSERLWKCPRCGRLLKPQMKQAWYHLPPHKCKGEVLGENQVALRMMEESSKVKAMEEKARQYQAMFEVC